MKNLLPRIWSILRSARILPWACAFISALIKRIIESQFVPGDRAFYFLLWDNRFRQEGYFHDDIETGDGQGLGMALWQLDLF